MFEKRWLWLAAKALAAATVLAPAFSLGAVDMFLKIEGIPGESTDDRHHDWIEVLSVSHGLFIPSDLGVSTDRCEHQDFMVVKKLDKASPKLALSCCMGTTISSATLTVLRNDLPTSPVLMRYDLWNVVVTSVKVMSPEPNAEGEQTLETGAERLWEEITLDYSKIKWTYTYYDSRGKPAGNTEAHWDLAANRPVIFTGAENAKLYE